MNERDALAAEVRALTDEVHGVERVCAHCGIECRTHRVSIRPDRVTGDSDIVFGVCSECGPAHDSGNLSASVVRDLLGLDPADPLLELLARQVTDFADRGRPMRPNSTPWEHVNATALADRAAAERQSLARRAGGPCSLCGVGLTPVGTHWMESGGGRNATTFCGSCQSEFDGRPRLDESENRDHVAAILCGLRRRGVTRRPSDLGKHLGVIWWSESGRKQANAAPFDHLDLAAMRAECRRLADERVFVAPARWNPERPGRIVWGLG